MRRSKILSLKGHNILAALIKNKMLIFLTALIVLGIYIGTLCFSKGFSPAVGYAQNSFNDFFALRNSSGTILKVFFSSLLFSISFPLLIFISGTSFVGTLFSPVAVFFKASLFGALSGYICSIYGLKGIAFNALLLVPCNLVAFIGLILAARESMAFSYTLARLTMPKGYTVSMFSDFKNYCMRYLVILVIFVFSALSDALCSRIFLKFFNF